MQAKFRQQEDILCRELYNQYVKTRHKVANGANQYTLYIKCVSGILESIGELILENDNGVFIEGFGYLYLQKKDSTYRKKLSIIRKKELNVHKLGFEFLDDNLNKKYKFSLNGRIADGKDNNKNFEYKKDAIQHYLQNIKE